MNEYYFKAYFKDNKTGVPFIVPVCEYNSTLEAAKQRVYVDCHAYEIAHACKLLYIYYDSDMKTVLQHDLERRCKHED